MDVYEGTLAGAWGAGGRRAIVILPKRDVLLLGARGSHHAMLAEEFDQANFEDGAWKSNGEWWPGENPIFAEAYNAQDSNGQRFSVEMFSETEDWNNPDQIAEIIEPYMEGMTYEGEGDRRLMGGPDEWKVSAQEVPVSQIDPKSLNVVFSEAEGWDDSEWWAYRMPVIYKAPTIYVGQEGTHHLNLEEEFGVASDRAWGEITPYNPANPLDDERRVFNYLGGPPPVNLFMKLKEYMPELEAYGGSDPTDDDWTIAKTAAEPTDLTGFDAWEVGAPVIEGSEYGDWTYDPANDYDMDTRRAWVMWLDGTVEISKPGQHHVEAFNMFPEDRHSIRALGIINNGEVFMYEGFNEKPQDKQAVEQELSKYGASVQLPEVVEGQASQGGDYPDTIQSDFWAVRLPWIYNPNSNKIYLGPAGAFHDDVMQSFNLRDDRYSGICWPDSNGQLQIQLFPRGGDTNPEVLAMAKIVLPDHIGMPLAEHFKAWDNGVDPNGNNWAFGKVATEEWEMSDESDGLWITDACPFIYHNGHLEVGNMGQLHSDIVFQHESFGGGYVYGRIYPNKQLVDVFEGRSPQDEPAAQQAAEEWMARYLRMRHIGTTRVQAYSLPPGFADWPAESQQAYLDMAQQAGEWAYGPKPGYNDPIGITAEEAMAIINRFDHLQPDDAPEVDGEPEDSAEELWRDGWSWKFAMRGGQTAAVAGCGEIGMYDGWYPHSHLWEDVGGEQPDHDVDCLGWIIKGPIDEGDTPFRVRVLSGFNIPDAQILQTLGLTGEATIERVGEGIFSKTIMQAALKEFSRERTASEDDWQVPEADYRDHRWPYIIDTNENLYIGPAGGSHQMIQWKYKLGYNWQDLHDTAIQLGEILINQPPVVVHAYDYFNKRPDTEEDKQRVINAWNGQPGPNDFVMGGSWMDWEKQEKYAATEETDIPAPPGTTPIPNGYVRLYHYTLAPADKLKQYGLLINEAKGENYGEPNRIWASTRFPQNSLYAGQNVVEFAVPVMDSRWDIGKYSPGVSYDGQHSPQAYIDYITKRGSNVTFFDSISPSEFIAVHETWHDHYRYMEDNAMSLNQYGWVEEQADRYPDEAKALAEYKRRLGMNYPGKPTYQEDHSSITCQDPDCSICAWLKKQKEKQTKTAAYGYSIIEGEYEPAEEDMFDGGRRPGLFYNDTIYLGQPGAFHQDVRDEFRDELGDTDTWSTWIEVRGDLLTAASTFSNEQKRLMIESLSELLGHPLVLESRDSTDWTLASTVPQPYRPPINYRFVPFTDFEIAGWDQVPQQERQQWRQRAERQNHRATLVGDPGRVHGWELWTLNKRFEGQCAYCHEPLPWATEGATLDHANPLSLGGAGDISNIVPSCRDCNQDMNNMDRKNNPDAMKREDYWVPDEFAGGEKMAAADDWKVSEPYRPFADRLTWCYYDGKLYWGNIGAHHTGIINAAKLKGEMVPPIGEQGMVCGWIDTPSSRSEAYGSSPEAQTAKRRAQAEYDSGQYQPLLKPGQFLGLDGTSTQHTGWEDYKTAAMASMSSSSYSIREEQRQIEIENGRVPDFQDWELDWGDDYSNSDHYRVPWAVFQDHDSSLRVQFGPQGTHHGETWMPQDLDNLAVAYGSSEGGRVYVYKCWFDPNEIQGLVENEMDSLGMDTRVPPKRFGSEQLSLDPRGEWPTHTTTNIIVHPDIKPMKTEPSKWDNRIPYIYDVEQDLMHIGSKGASHWRLLDNAMRPWYLERGMEPPVERWQDIEATIEGAYLDIDGKPHAIRGGQWDEEGEENRLWDDKTRSRLEELIGSSIIDGMDPDYLPDYYDKMLPSSDDWEPVLSEQAELVS